MSFLFRDLEARKEEEEVERLEKAEKVEQLRLVLVEPLTKHIVDLSHRAL